MYGRHPRRSTIAKTCRSRLRRRRPAPSIEALEARQLLALLVGDVLRGTSDTRVTGTVYQDLNSNGVKDTGDDGLPAWRVYVDLDGSGTYNTDAVGAWEPSALTNGDGDFTISRLIPGTYRVAEVLPAGWTPTAPMSRDVVVTLNKEIKTAFFNFAGGAVEGAVWNDLDRDGTRLVDATTGAFGEPGLAGWTMFVDLNGDTALDAGDPVTTTDAEGRYRFAGLTPGDYEVYQVLPDGWEPTRGSDVHQTVAVTALQTSTTDFGNVSDTSGTLRGTVWNDLNFNGIRDADPVTGEWIDPGLSGWTIFVDLDGDGLPGVGEPTSLTDADGLYVFPSLAAGDYLVAAVLPDRWNVVDGSSATWPVTVAAGATTDAPDVAVFTVLNGSIAGAIWNDRFRDGRRDVAVTGGFLDPGLAGWTVFLDRNRNRSLDAGDPIATTDVAGTYRFTDLQVGDYELFEVVPAGWEPTLGFDVSQTATVVSGATTTARDFANFNLTSVLTGSVSGTVWNDVGGDGIRDVVPGGGFADPGVSGRTVFVDLDGNGIRDVGEPVATSAADGTYTIASVVPGTVTIAVETPTGWSSTAPVSATRKVTVRNGAAITGVDFGSHALQRGVVSGTVFHDADGDGARGTGEAGIAGLTVYLDLDDDGVLDAGEPQTVTAEDKFFTPGIDEAGTWEFTHLAAGTHVVRVLVPDPLSATPAASRRFAATMTGTGSATGLDTAARYRLGSIRGTRYDDADADGVHDPGETGVAGATVYLDLDRDGARGPGEPTTTTAADGTYAFTGLSPGAYVVRDEIDDAHDHTLPATRGGTLWPPGTSNPAVGLVTPTSITASLASGESLRRSVSLTLPGSGALTNMVDVFLLFDDTGSFTWNSPIVRGAFPTIIASLNAALPGSDLGFGVGRFEEYGAFAGEYATGRPFILNQPIVAASTPGSMTAIQAALDRTTPGYGGDAPETDIEALYQLVTGRGFDGNNNGSVLDSGAAGLAATQLSPGSSGDVPSFASFVADAANGVLPAAGTVGGGGFRAGALPIVLLATDVGFAYQPKGETVVTGVGGLSLPVGALTGNSRPTTPFNSGAGLQETITALNALGALVIGLGTNAEPTLDPRAGLEAISKLTGAVNRSAATIANGTADPVAPGDPLYFQIASGFASSVASGVVNAIQNAATSVAVDLTVRASDPRVRIVNHTGVVAGVGAGRTATFDVEFVGNGLPHRFDLQFVRNGTGVVLGSIPVVLGTPVPGDGYAFEDCRPGEIHGSVDFGVRALSGGPVSVATIAPAATGLASLATTYGAASMTTSTTIQGTALTADITATAPAGFEVSSDGTTFGPTATFAQAGGVASGRLHVRLTATTGAGTWSGNVTLASAGATAVTVAIPSSTVAKKMLTVTAGDAGRLLDEADPTFAASITGFVNGETVAVVSGAVALSTTATGASPAGTYAITAAAGTLTAANYDFSFTPGTLTVGDTLVFDVSAAQTLTYSTARSAALKFVKRGAGTLVLDAAGSHTGLTTVEAGSLVIAHGDALSGSAVYVNTGATLKVNAGVTMRSPTVTIAGGTLDGTGAALLVNATTGIGTLAITAGSVTGSPQLTVSGNGVVTLPTDRRQVVALKSLTVDRAGGGRIDIGKGRLDIAIGGTTEADLRAIVIAGRGSGAFDGTAGIMTTGGKASPTSQNPVVGYRILTTGAAIVAWAAYGDVNLDGKVDATDTSLINQGAKFGKGISTGATWYQGDFNYSGGVTTTDTGLINSAGLFGKGSYLPVTPAGAQEGSAPATGTLSISQDAWITLAIDSQNQTTKKKP